MEYQEARALKETIRAEVARLDYEQALAGVVDAAEVAALAEKCRSVTREVMEGWIDQIAPLLAPVGDPDEVRQLLDGAVRELCFAIIRHLKGVASEAR